MVRASGFLAICWLDERLHRPLWTIFHCLWKSLSGDWRNYLTRAEFSELLIYKLTLTKHFCFFPQYFSFVCWQGLFLSPTEGDTWTFLSVCAFKKDFVLGECLWMLWLPQQRTAFGQSFRNQTWGWRSGFAGWSRGESFEVCIHVEH